LVGVTRALSPTRAGRSTDLEGARSHVRERRCRARPGRSSR
jgi:hypothetical protein